MTALGNDATGDAARAAKIADGLEDSGDLRVEMPMSVLLHQFGRYRLSSTVRTALAEALNDAGLTADPPLSDVRRSGSIIVGLGPAAQAGLTSAVDRARDQVSATIWNSAAPAEPLQIRGLAHVAQHALTWFNVDVHRTTDVQAEASRMYDALKAFCPGLSRQMVRGLFDPSPDVGVTDLSPHTRGQPSSVVRRARVRQVRALDPVAPSDAHDLRRPEDDPLPRVGRLERRTITLLVGDSWIVSSWSELELRIGSGHATIATPPTRHHAQAEIERSVSERWAVSQLATGFDLALVILLEIVNGYSIARRQLYSWLDAWDSALYDESDRMDRRTLLDLRSFATLFLQDVVNLRQPGVAPEGAWFPVSAESALLAQRLDAAIDRTIADLRDFGYAVRASFELLLSSAVAQEQENQNRFNLALGVITTVLLGPTLVAQLLSVQPMFLLRPAAVGLAAIFATGLLLGGAAYYGGLRLLGRRDQRSRD